MDQCAVRGIKYYSHGIKYYLNINTHWHDKPFYWCTNWLKTKTTVIECFIKCLLMSLLQFTRYKPSAISFMIIDATAAVICSTLNRSSAI